MKKKPGDFEIDEYGATTSTALRAAAEEDFEKLWNERSDFDNPDAEPYIDIITEKWCYETQLEVRKNADELMRYEPKLSLMQNIKLNSRLSQTGIGSPPRSFGQGQRQKVQEEEAKEAEREEEGQERLDRRSINRRFVSGTRRQRSHTALPQSDARSVYWRF